MKKLFLIIIYFIVTFIATLGLTNNHVVNAQTQETGEILIHPSTIGSQPHNYFYACSFTAQDFSWFTYTNHDPNYNYPWSNEDGNAILINTGLLGLSGKAIIGISIIASSSFVQDIPGTFHFLGNLNLPISYWDTTSETADTSNSIHASEFLSLNNRFPEQFFDDAIFPFFYNNEIIFSFSSNGMRRNFLVPFIAGDIIVLKHDFSSLHFIRSIRLYFARLQYFEGYQDGYEQGLSDGFDSGYTQGYEEGYEEGLADSFDFGYTQGYEEGYQSGYNAGISGTITPNWFTSFIDSIFDIFSIEIFPNIKLIYLFFIPIGLGVIILIFKLIRG